jgi:hypothetical protein
MDQEFFKRYRLVNGHRILSGCPYCQGALFDGHQPLGSDGLQVYKCFHCARMYRLEDGHLVLWPFREYPHLKGRHLLAASRGV